MTFNEWKKSKASLFTEVFNLLPENVFGSMELSKIDMVYSHLYGNRTIPKSMEENTVSEVAEKIVILYEDKWTNQHDLLYNEIVKGLTSEKTYVEEGSNDSNRTMNRTNTDNVSAFNDVGYSPDTEEIETNTDSNVQNHNNSRTEQNRSLWAVQQQLQMYEKSFLKDIVLKDVSAVTTLSIY